MQDVVEIMKESLYDKYVDENGFVDFGRSGGMSQQKEAKRFLSALNKQSELQQKDNFSISVSTLDCLKYCIIMDSTNKVIFVNKTFNFSINCSGNIQFGR